MNPQIATLAEYRGIVLKTLNRHMFDGWEGRNFPKGAQSSTEKNTCPHSEMLVEMAAILGISGEKILEHAWNFCGRHVHGVNNLGPLSGARGTEFQSDTFCERLYHVLSNIAELELFEPIPVEIRPDGSIEATLEAATIEEMDELYHRLRQSVTRAHFAEKFAQVSAAIDRLTQIFGVESELKPVVLKFLPQMRGVAFIPKKGCEIAPKSDFIGTVA